MRRVTRVGIVAVCAAVLGLAGSLWAASALLVDNFDRGEKPNALGGDFGSWDKDPADPTQKCTVSFDKENAFGQVGYSLRIDYDVDSPNPAYNGFWTKLQGIDASAHTQLSFYVRGDTARGYSPQVKLELKNGNEVGRYLVKGITDQWQQVRIPLKDFEGISDWTALTELVIVFDDVTSIKKVGTIYLDQIAFDG